ncbi:TetR/AcrR family transcriptional regulator [Haliea sp. E17]|uniref:TetR/AcrR family transcriptional regulator n=1 Tax=Haliea sp. E17 TaxID=3401576 RepID=UPI003AAB6AAB
MQISEMERRRQAVARVAADLIAREGREAATVRRIAEELGCSTTMITHYFDDKDEVLSLAYLHIAEQGRDRFLQTIEGPAVDLLEVLLSMTIYDEESLRRWRVYMAFWERASHDPVFAEVQREWTEKTQEDISRVICQCYGQREEAPGIAQQLIALVHGISLQTLFGETSWSSARTRSVLGGEIQSLLGPRKKSQ